MLEKESVQATRIIEHQEPAPVPAPQKEHPVLGELRETETDKMTPLDALAKLADWKRRLNKGV